MFNFSSYSFQINMNKNAVQYFQVISFLQLTFTNMTEIKQSLNVNSMQD